MPTCLADVVVLEVGDRVAVSLCGSLLAQLGATVISCEATAPAANGAAARAEPARIAGKLRLAVDGNDAADSDLLRRTALRADIVLRSQEDADSWSALLPQELAGAAVMVDVSAYGSIGPFARLAHPDALVQASSALIDTTGSPDAAPFAIGVPICEFLAATHAAAGALAGLRSYRRDGIRHGVEIALYDCAIETLATFLARGLAGLTPTRVGNRHPNISPFNTYRASDGWLNLCTGNDGHWQLVCKVIGRSDIAQHPRFISMTKRAGEMDAIDAMIEDWTKTHTVDECMREFLDQGIPAGPVTPISEIEADRDFIARGVVQRARDPATGADIAIPGSVFAFSVAQTLRPHRFDTPEADRERIAAIAQSDKPDAPVPRPSEAAPLSDLLVVEIGQYTTGPRASRHLAALGAEVIKIEMPPHGDPARTYAPMRGGQSHFFHLNNSGKQTLVLDLKSADGAADIHKLLARADILVENLKPGALTKLGLGPKAVLARYPNLVYCSISGYGTASVYQGRPGMDSVVQGMAGLMDATRAAGRPYKGGISISDICGGQLAVVAIMAALEYRERHGAGQFIDVSMLDVSAWLTHLAWNGAGKRSADAPAIVQCSDGFVAAAARALPAAKIDALCDRWRNGGAKTLPFTRDELVAKLATLDIAAAAVRSVAETLTHPQSTARGLIAQGTAPDGQLWSHVTTPVRIAGMELPIMRAAGKLLDDQARLSARFGLTSPAAAQVHRQPDQPIPN